LEVDEMAFTTATRLKDLLRQASGTSPYGVPSSAAITNAVNAANGELEKMGVPSTETDAGLLGAADLLALAYLGVGQSLFQGARGQHLPSPDSVRRGSTVARTMALEMAGRYISHSRRLPNAVRNRNWANQRGGQLWGDSEADGRHNRDSKK